MERKPLLDLPPKNEVMLNASPSTPPGVSGAAIQHRVSMAMGGLLSGALMIWGPASVAAQCAYEVVAVEGMPPCTPATGLQPVSINNKGEVAGFFLDCGIGPARPFYWSAGTGLVFPSLPPNCSAARFTDINDSGQISGFGVLPGAHHEAMLYENGTWTPLGFGLGGTDSEGLAINNAGTVVGFYSNPAAGGLLPQACRWDRGTITTIGPSLGFPESSALCISDSGLIAGYVSAGVLDSELGFILDGEESAFIPPFPGTVTAKVFAINDSGTALVQGRPPMRSPGIFSFVMNGRSWEQILGPEPEQIWVYGRRINQSGSVVGYARGPGLGNVPFLYANGKSMSLTDQVLVKPPPDVHLGFVYCVNDAGWLSADGYIDIFTPLMLILRPVDPLPEDLDDDCSVGASDLALLLGSWGGSGPADLDSDGVVGANDLALLLGTWSPSSN